MTAIDDSSDGQERHITASLLRRLLSSVEDNARSRRLEFGSAVLLGLTTTASAWCAYQSNLWSGVEMFRLVAISQAARRSTQQTIAANQFRTIDLGYLNAFIEARLRGDPKKSLTSCTRDFAPSRARCWMHGCRRIRSVTRMRRSGPLTWPNMLSPSGRQPGPTCPGAKTSAYASKHDDRVYWDRHRWLVLPTLPRCRFSSAVPTGAFIGSGRSTLTQGMLLFSASKVG